MSYCFAGVFAVWSSPPGRLVAAIALAIVLWLRAAEQRTLMPVALVVLAAGILQAVPWAFDELGFQFNLGRARWASLMAEAHAALERGDTAMARARLEAALADTSRFKRPVLAATSAEQLADLLLREGRPADARPWLAEALRWREKVPGPDATATRETRERLAGLDAQLGDHAGSTALRAVQVESAARAEGEQSAPVAQARCQLAASLGHLGREADAAAQLQQAADALERLHGAHHWSVAEPLLGLAALLRRQGQSEEAEAALRRALGNADMAGQTALANRAREALVDLLLERGRVAEAVPISEAALRSQEAGAADRDRSLELLERHADVLSLAGDESARYRRRAELIRGAMAKEAGRAP